MRLVADMGVALTPSTLLCGGLWYFKKREAAQIIAFQTVANAFACLAQLWLMKSAGHFEFNSSRVSTLRGRNFSDMIRSNDSYINCRGKALASRTNTAMVSGILLAVAAKAVKSKRTISAKQLALPIVAMSVLSLLAGGFPYTSLQPGAQTPVKHYTVNQHIESAFNSMQSWSFIAVIGIICYRRWGFR